MGDYFFNVLLGEVRMNTATEEKQIVSEESKRQLVLWAAQAARVALPCTVVFGFEYNGAQSSSQVVTGCAEIPLASCSYSISPLINVTVRFDAERLQIGSKAFVGVQVMPVGDEEPVSLDLIVELQYTESGGFSVTDAGRIIQKEMKKAIKDW